MGAVGAVGAVGGRCLTAPRRSSLVWQVNGRASDTLHSEEAHKKHGKTRFPKKEGDDFRHGKAWKGMSEVSKVQPDDK
jgi:hypothetical protein